jgi:hypothetical protein
MDIQILNQDEYIPSTVTMVSSFDKTINPKDVAEYLPVVHLFHEKTGKRLKLDSGTRTSIKYYGIENIIISVCYKKTRRGMRTGAMNNMVSLDIQHGGKNIHVKLSSTTITSVGTSGYQFGVDVFNLMIQHLNMLNQNIKYIKSMDSETRDKNLEWVFDNCVDEKGRLVSVKSFLKLIKNNSWIDKNFAKSCIVYTDDFEPHQIDEYRNKIKNFIENTTFYNGDLKCMKPSIFNSVYHINLFKNIKNKRIPLHRLAPYLAEKNFVVEFHNWISEGVNVCFDIEEEKDGVHHKDKEYKHRFTIHERGTMRQCSPTFKEESYKYYLGIVKQIEQFFKDTNTAEKYKEYIEYGIKE